MSTPIKLGIAGGPIIVGILMGAFGPRFHLTTYTTQSANLMMRQFGIVIYLAGLGTTPELISSRPSSVPRDCYGSVSVSY